MRRLLTALTAISLVGTLFIGTPAPVYADADETAVDSAKVQIADGELDVIHVADALESAGKGQLYLADAGDTISLSLNLFGDGAHADGIYDIGMSLSLDGGTGVSFGSTYTDSNDAACLIDWPAAGDQTATLRGLEVDCDAASGQLEVNVPFNVTVPNAGSAVLTVTGAGETFKVYFFAAQEDDTIYVGQDNSYPSDGGTCGAAGPDFSTTNIAQGLTEEKAIDFALQSIDEDTDTVVICNGTYVYGADIREYYGSDLYTGTLTMRADTTGEVTLDGDANHHLLNVNEADLSVEGINFHDGEAYNGGAIYVANDSVDGVFVGGNLTVLDSIFTSNEADGAFGSGGAIYVEGSLTVNHSSFEDSVAATDGGAIYVYGANYEDEQTIIADVEFHGNYAVEGGAIAVIDSQMTVIRAEFTANGAEDEGGAIYVYDTNWSVSHSTFGSADDDHDDPELENYAREGGDIHSSTGTIENAVTASITHTKFYDSRAVEDGASLFMDCAALDLSHSLFHSTDSSEDAVIFLTDDEEGCFDYRATITHTTFTDNYAFSDGVIFVDAGSEGEGVSGLLSLSVTNSLFSGNVAEESEGVFDVAGPVDISIINSRFERNRAGDNGAIIEMDGGDDAEDEYDEGDYTGRDTSNGSLVFSRNQVRFNTAGTDSSSGDGMIQLDDVHSWQIDYNTFQGNSADRGAVLAFEVDDDDLRDLIQLNGFRRNTIIGNSALVGGSYLFIQYNDNASNVKRASIKRIEQQVKKNRNIIKGGTRPAVLQLLDLFD